MNARDIFKMEMYKNSTDKPYLIVGGVLSGLGIILTACWLLMINVMNTSQAEGSTSGSGGGIIIFLGLLVMISFSFLVGTYFLGLLYPFHLLNVDYRSKVLSLMVASGVSRVRYYFVKIAATVLSTLIMMTVILVIPIVTLLIFNMTSIIGAVKMFTGLSIAPNIIIVLIGGILSSISAVVVMASAVIMLRGKVSSFFVYIGFS
ncbi:MAG: ABC transporter permease, partial [Streptococcaceae bacterium]|nr:ABC transporter permease [Streptococcaceae bacterium]